MAQGRAQHHETPAVPGNRRSSSPVLFLRMGRNFPQAPLESAPSRLHPWERSWMGNLPTGSEMRRGKAASPRKLVQDRAGRRGLRLGPGNVCIIFGRWVVLLRFKCPAVYQSLPVQRFLHEEHLSCLPASSFPRFCFSSAFPQPLITQFSSTTPQGKKKKDL